MLLQFQRVRPEPSQQLLTQPSCGGPRGTQRIAIEFWVNWARLAHRYCLPSPCQSTEAIHHVTLSRPLASHSGLPSLDSSSTPQCSTFSSSKDLTHQPGGVALCAASPPGVVGETCWTVGGNDTPTAWNTLPHVP